METRRSRGKSYDAPRERRFGTSEIVVVDSDPETIETVKRFIEAASRGQLVQYMPRVVSRPRPGKGSTLRLFLRRVFGTSEILEEMKNVSREMDHLSSEVAQARSVMASATILVTNLAAHIRANLTDPVALEALANDLDSSATALAATVTENTPAANLGNAEGGTGGTGGADTGGGEASGDAGEESGGAGGAEANEGAGGGSSDEEQSGEQTA